MNSSKLLIICCLIFALFACGPKRLSKELAQQQTQRVVQDLSSRYGLLDKGWGMQYLHYLEERLKDGARGKLALPDNFRILLLSSDTPIAFAPGDGLVFISRGLVLSLRNEAELAFVVSHELSHQLLGHTSLDLSTKNPWPPLEDTLYKEIELEADRYALGLVAIAGYDPNYSINALLNSYRAAHIAQASETHPELEARIRAIRASIAESGWSPPGTVNRWGFNQLRLELQSVHG